MSGHEYVLRNTVLAAGFVRAWIVIKCLEFHTVFRRRVSGWPAPETCHALARWRFFIVWQENAVHPCFSFFLFSFSWVSVQLTWASLSLSALFPRTALYSSCQPKRDISPYVAACTDALIWSDWLCRFFNSDIAYCQKEGESCTVQGMIYLCLHGWFASRI